MAKCKYDWPDASQRRLIGKRIKRIDGPAKASGRAKYTFDINRPGMLFGKVLRSPYAHATVKSIDTSEAEKLPGVKAVRVIKGAGKEAQWQGDEIAVVAAEREEVAEDAIRKIKVEPVGLPVDAQRDRRFARPHNFAGRFIGSAARSTLSGEQPG